MSKLSEYLIKKQCKTYFWQEEEKKFYSKYVKLIPSSPSFKAYKNAKKPFDVIRANIVIRGILNKNIIEKEIRKRKFLLKLNVGSVSSLLSDVKDIANELPSFTDKNNNKIIIPFFMPHLNDVYLNRIDCLTRNPYKKLRNHFIDISVDPFDTYGPSLFDSEFSKLIKISENGKVFAYYDYDSQTIYFIDEQGRLENSFALFDRDLVNSNKSNIPERVRPIVEAYFSDNREAIIRALIDNKLVSSKTIQEFVDSEEENNYDEAD